MADEKPEIRVLLVDDEEEFLAATARVLERRAIKVTRAVSGAEALSELARAEPEVVVLDLKMPGMTGEELFRRIRDDHPELPVLMLTGHGSIPHAFEMSRSGIDDYLAKPCDPGVLAERCHQLASTRLGPPSPPVSGLDHPTVLLVDDEPELLRSLARVLGRRGMEVTTVPSGEAALIELARTPIDVVVLDWKMPGMDGLETLTWIKRDFPDREVVILTGHPRIENAFAGIRHGAMEYVTKPPDIGHLEEVIRKAFDTRRRTLHSRQREVLGRLLDRQPE